MALRERPTASSLVDAGTAKVRELRDLARRLERRAANNELRRTMPQLCADMRGAAEGIRYLCRALEIAGTDSITIEIEPDQNTST